MAQEKYAVRLQDVENGGRWAWIGGAAVALAAALACALPQESSPPVPTMTPTPYVTPTPTSVPHPQPAVEYRQVPASRYLSVKIDQEPPGRPDPLQF